ETIAVYSGSNNSDNTWLGDGQEMMWAGGGSNGINGDANTTIGTIFEADWEGETRSQLSMKLGFGSTSTDSSDREQICKELRRDGVEHFRGQWNSKVGQLDEQGS